MSVKINDKVELEQIIDEYLLKNIPISLFLEKYSITFPQMQLLMNRIRGFSRQTDMLSKNNPNFSYDDLPEDYLVIPHDVTEEYPIEHDELMNLFAVLENIKSQMPNINIESRELELAAAKEKVASYNPELIKNIEAFISDYDKTQAEHGSISAPLLIVLLERNNLQTKESSLLNQIYDSYLKDKEYLLKCENELFKEKAKKKESYKLNAEYEKIRETILVHNLKLVNWCIRKFFNNIALPKEDTQAVGIEGLVKAINTFDYKKGFHFSTYAVTVIVRNIEHHFDELYGMDWQDFINKEAIKYYRELMMETDKTRIAEPTAQELADMGLINLSAKKISNYDHMIDGISPISAVSEDLSDDYPQTKRFELPQTEEDYELIDEYEDKYSTMSDTDIEEIFINKALKSDLEKVLETLTEKEQNVLKLRFGFDSEPVSYEKIGEIYGVGKERIRQIEAKALRKLRHPMRASQISNYHHETQSIYRESREIEESRLYSKLAYLLSLNLTKDAILSFMNMENISWNYDDLEEAIEKLYETNEYIITSFEDGEPSYSIARNIANNYQLFFTSKYILDIIKKHKEEQILNEEQTKKM